MTRLWQSFPGYLWYFDGFPPWQAVMHSDQLLLLEELVCPPSGRGNPHLAPENPILVFIFMHNEEMFKFCFLRAGQINVKHPSLIPYSNSILTNTSSPPPKARRHAADKPPSCCWNCPKHLDIKQLNSEILSFWIRYEFPFEAFLFRACNSQPVYSTFPWFHRLRR